MKQFKGSSLKNKSSIGLLTTSREVFPRDDFVIMSYTFSKLDVGYAGCICSSDKLPLFTSSAVKIDELDNLTDIEGDIVGISSDGFVSVLWERDSYQNVLFLTDSCNTRCKMCPQPPRQHDPSHIEKANRILNLIKKKDIKNICITGGEPTLLKEDFPKILNRCVSEHPEARIEILSNGQTFSDFQYAKKIAALSAENVRFCISLHGDTDNIHDEIVQKTGAFHKTHQGIHNLTKLGVSIELRYVINKYNYSRLDRMAEYISRNYPFISHFAVMGLEMTGLALDNKSEVWIDPIDYSKQLERFVVEANRRNLPVSLYNHQLCVIPKIAWPIAKQSISEWKKDYKEECLKCSVKEQCGGLFLTSGQIISRAIKSIN